MSFDLRQYIDKAKYNSEGPVKGDILELQINKEIVIECDCDRIDNDITIAVDEIGYKIFSKSYNVIPKLHLEPTSSKYIDNRKRLDNGIVPCF